MNHYISTTAGNIPMKASDSLLARINKIEGLKGLKEVNLFPHYITQDPVPAYTVPIPKGSYSEEGVAELLSGFKIKMGPFYVPSSNDSAPTASIDVFVEEGEQTVHLILQNPAYRREERKLERVKSPPPRRRKKINRAYNST
ncbi:hypothetical protein JXB11_02425 [Candidatus Woesearchaeota archaeon]|nr:hypothetical protein [Candidatus Woesearchaeota archaeon]